MNACHDVEHLLDDYVDGELDEVSRVRVEEHLPTCPSCREQYLLTADLLERAAGLDADIAPSRDLWPAIAGRIDTEKVVFLRGRTVRWIAAATLAAAAVLVLVVLPIERSSSPAADRVQADSGARLAVSAAEPSIAGYDDLDRAARELRRALEERKANLSPQTLEVVEENLAIIDQAIANVKRALGEDPDNQALAVLLTATCQRKIDLLKLATDASQRT